MNMLDRSSWGTPESVPRRVRSRALRLLSWATFVAVLLLGSRPASAYPWMIRHQYQGCVPCHADPSGAGLLTEYGRAMGENVLRTRYGSPPPDEPPIYARTRENLSAAGKQADFLEIFSPAMRKTTLLACLLTTGAQGGYYAISTWLPTYLRDERHLTILGTGGYLAVIITGAFVGGMISAWLSDRIGRRSNFILFAACSIATVVGYTQVPVDDTLMLFLGFPLGFFSQGVFSGMGPFLTELYPTRMRGSGQGFSYNFGRGIAAMNPTLVGMLSATLPLGQSIGVFAILAYTLLTIAALMLPETRGWRLTAEA